MPEQLFSNKCNCKRFESLMNSFEFSPFGAHYRFMFSPCLWKHSHRLLRYMHELKCLWHLKTQKQLVNNLKSSVCDSHFWRFATKTAIMIIMRLEIRLKSDPSKFCSQKLNKNVCLLDLKYYQQLMTCMEIIFLAALARSRVVNFGKFDWIISVGKTSMPYTIYHRLMI